MLDVTEAAAVDLFGINAVRAWLDPDVAPDPGLGSVAVGLAAEPDPATWGMSAEAQAGMAAFDAQLSEPRR